MTAAIVVLGFFVAPRLAVALLPSFAPPVVTVSTAYGNASPETIESTVTRPIENAVSRVSGIDILESNSFQGQSTVRVQFDFGTDINVAAVTPITCGRPTRRDHQIDFRGSNPYGDIVQIGAGAKDGGCSRSHSDRDLCGAAF